MSTSTIEPKNDSNNKYGFYGRLKARFPSQIIVDVTEICNLACIHCSHRIFKKSKYYGGRTLDPNLNEKIVEEVKEHGKGITQYIRYTGEGEPLTNKDIYGILKYAVKNSGVTVTLTTNGTIMNENRIERLLDTGVDVIDISIDAFSPKTYAKIRINGNLAVTKKNVLKLLQMSKQTSVSTMVVVSYIEQPENIHETKDFEAFWKDSGADYVVVRRLHSNSGTLQDIADDMRAQNSILNRRPCLYPWERIVLNPRGHLAFCPADWTLGSTIIDYRHTTVYNTWKDKFYQKLRKSHLENDFKNFKFCGQCPDWRATRWPDEGRSYANLIEEFKEFE
jgi:MoaA/NifB/PqqE/SkfB family radical SAM enzyme